ncbi:hypothetical protein L1887_00349 [Cichorium endivia]|nr:hypothetical protein L1887_00349 [Cichorium endivia]
MGTATAAAASSLIKSTVVQLGRIRVLKEGIHQHTQPPSSSSNVGPVVYWMFRDQRLRDNWALIHAVDQANRLNVPVAVAFNLFDQFLGAKARQLGFMLRGLQQLHTEIEETLHIPFFLFQGEAVETIPSFLQECGASLLVTDFSPLRQVRGWKEEITKRVSDSVSIHEVDAHNIVPLWITSNKLESAARTIRPKIDNLLPDYLIDFPPLKPQSRIWPGGNRSIDWETLIADVVRKGDEVPEIDWCKPGEVPALETLMGNENGFLTTRLKNYATDRNNPSKQAISGLSPYIHFGQISAQRCAFEARKLHKAHPQAVDVFLRELIVFRELSDNFCYYQPHYDSLQGAWDWARNTLMEHALDKREHLREQLENAETADDLWNASQLEMVHYGKMHGFMRMYWAKKILEWTNSPQEALEIAIYLNDKGWQERPVFGKIRIMTYAGCKRKFDVDGYIAYVERLVEDIKKRNAETLSNNKAKQLAS